MLVPLMSRECLERRVVLEFVTARNHLGKLIDDAESLGELNRGNIRRSLNAAHTALPRRRSTRYQLQHRRHVCPSSSEEQGRPPSTFLRMHVCAVREEETNHLSMTHVRRPVERPKIGEITASGNKTARLVDRRSSLQQHFHSSHLYEGAIKALLRRYESAIKAVLRRYCGAPLCSRNSRL